MYQSIIKDEVECDIIIMSFNRLNNLKICLDSIDKYTKNVKYQLIVIDAGSNDGSREWLLQNYSSKAALIFENRRWSYAQSCNNGMRYGRAKYIAMLNDDCKATENWLRTAIDALNSDDTIGHAAHVVLRADENHIMSSGANFNHAGCTIIPTMDLKWKNPANRIKVRDMCLNYGYAGFGVYRRDLLERVGYLPEFPTVIYFDDSDYGLKINALGYDVRLIPDSVIIHFMVHTGRDKHSLSANIAHRAFMQRWGEFLKENNGFDPCVSKNRPYLNGKKDEIYSGEPYKPLGFAVSGEPKDISKVENTWL